MTHLFNICGGSKGLCMMNTVDDYKITSFLLSIKLPTVQENVFDRLIRQLSEMYFKLTLVSDLQIRTSSDENSPRIMFRDKLNTFLISIGETQMTISILVSYTVTSALATEPVPNARPPSPPLAPQNPLAVLPSPPFPPLACAQGDFSGGNGGD
jgi:hypothetical protein